MDIELIVQTICTAVFLGISAQVISQLVRLPAIIFLFILGILAGPNFFHIIHVNELGGTTEALTSVGVGVILFEGGLSLRLSDLKHAPKAIYSIIVFGPLLTLIMGGLGIHAITDLSYDVSFVIAAILTVSGPTVIHSLMHKVRVQKKLHDILIWEANIVEAVGGILMVVVLHYVEAAGDSFLITAWHFVERLLVGGVIGYATGRLLIKIIKSRLVDHNLLNLVILAILFLTFWLSNHIASESGLLTAAVAGLLTGQLRHAALEEIKLFKVQMSTLIISIVFIFLAASLEFDAFVGMGWPLVGVILLLFFVVRPVMILLSTLGFDLNLREKLFIGWIGPKGVVAAATASLFAMILEHHHVEQAHLVEVVVMSVVGFSVLWTGLTIDPIAKLFKVLAAPHNGFLIVGSNSFAIRVAQELKQHDIPVKLIDQEGASAHEAMSQGVDVAICNYLDEVELGRNDLHRIGNMLALTEDDHNNTMVCRVGRKLFGMDHAFQLVNTFLSDVTDEVLQDFGGIPAFDLKMSAQLISDRIDSGRLRVETIELKAEHREHNQLPENILSALFFLDKHGIRVAEEDGKINGHKLIGLSLVLD
ncbi:MAG: NhaP-type Na+/H+ or K+/H+ antiporter [Candidatus Latescibacterota bacterium]|jgi:NhaP-type Na+/H+ or K+/H+ antiporter